MTKNKIFSAVLAGLILLSLSGCGTNQETAEKETSTPSQTVSSDVTSDTDNSDDIIAESSETNQTATPDESGITAEEKKDESKPTASSESSKPQQTQKPKNKDDTTSSKPETSKPPATSSDPPTQSQTITLPKDASQSDAAAVANKIIEYVNQYRISQGAGAATKLSGLTQVAQYRSNQLVTNFAHDINATNESTRHFQYGEHIVYGELDYYDHSAREAIGKSGSNNSVDRIAEIMATSFRNSANHWNYVGGADYKYIAVGATYGNNQWYICILMSKINTYG